MKSRICRFVEETEMKQIKEFPSYTVDEYGNVYNTKKNKLKAQQTYNGYKYVQLHNNGKPKVALVHRLVAEAFIPNPEKLPCINHKDENKLNNSVENLEWCTYQYNNHYGKSKPTESAAEARKKAVEQYTMQGELVAVFESASEAQRQTGIKQSNISKVCLGRPTFHSAGGYVWKFAD